MMFGRNHLKALLLLYVRVALALSGGRHKLPCHPGEYQIREGCCRLCPIGQRVEKDCTEFRNTSCQPCTEETFMSRSTAKRMCLPCASCNAGSGLKIKTACTTTSDTVCEPQEGFYCMNSTKGGCSAAQKHTSCQPGQYISQKGTALKDTVCSGCNGETYSDGTFTSCQQHTRCESKNLLLKKTGTVSTDAECGEKSLDLTGIEIGISVPLSLLLIGAAVWCYFRKKKERENTESQRDADNPEPRNI